MEIWKDIKDYEGLYQISSFGRVKNIKKTKILKGGFNGRYKTITLYKNKIGKTFSIHRLVYINFINKIPNNYEIDHIDTNALNNNVDNLRLVTSKENSNNPLSIINYRNSKIGTKHPKTKKVYQYSLDGIFIKEWEYVSQIKEKLGYNTQNITACCRGEINKAYKYFWTYQKL